MVLSVATKIHSVCLLLPIFFLGWRKDGWAVFAKPKNYLYCLGVSVSLLWYFFMWKAVRIEQLAYNPFRYALTGSYWDSFAPSLMKLPAKTLLFQILTPLGAVLFVLGVSRSSFKKYSFVWIWLLSVVIYLLVMWPTAVIHPYYMLPLVPPASFFVGLGAESLFTSKKTTAFFRNPLMIVLFVFLEAASVLYYYRLLYFIPPDRALIVEAGKATEASTPKDALVLAAWETSPIQLYYCNRKGWVFELARPEAVLISDLEEKRKKGASHFVTATLSDLHGVPAFEKYLRSHYKPILETDGFVLFDLRTAR